MSESDRDEAREHGDARMARASMREEREAIRNYSAREQRASPRMRADIRHIKREEKHHVRMLRRHARRGRK